jgi:aspartyl-tRNA(Asn)/glutamyl-tRNA(Gln) amidotransferase subunit B
VQYEIVIGLEAHAQLLTRTKLFCGCSLRFGEPPNSQTCPVCTGQPGSLPVLNRTAVEYGLKTALTLGCRINRHTVFDRKNYYYPDLPKNYQISQNYSNLGVDGAINLEVGDTTRHVRIHNVHLEEDAGKLLHPEDTASAIAAGELAEDGEPDFGPGGPRPLSDFTLVDLNRAGTPLAEIVTEPDLRSVEEARVYMETLAGILQYLGVSDCKMEEGSLRFEASISLRPVGSEKLGNRVEIKNVNSVKAVVRALEYEVRRQTDCLDHGETIGRETRLWNEAAGRTAPMRSKELAHDYRYFPEPDLVPIEVDDAWIERVRASIPELLAARRRRFMAELGLPAYDAAILVENRALADYFEACVRLGAEPKAASNWIQVGVLRELNARAIPIAELKVSPSMLCDLIRLVAEGAIAPNPAKDVFAEMAESGKPAAAIIEAKGLRQISDTGELEAIVLRILRENPQPVADLRAGKKQAQGFLMGQVMKATKGKANPKIVADLIARKLPEA